MTSWDRNKSASAKDGLEGPFKGSVKNNLCRIRKNTRDTYSRCTVCRSLKGCISKKAPDRRSFQSDTDNMNPYLQSNQSPEESEQTAMHVPPGTEGLCKVRPSIWKIHHRWTFWWRLWMAHAWVPSDPLGNKGFLSSHTFGASLVQWGGVGWGARYCLTVFSSLQPKSIPMN